MTNAREFVGRGWAFPLRADASGDIALVSHDREIEESIRLILGTAYGERPMRPEFGCGIHDYVFESIDAYTIGQLDQEIRVALETLEPEAPTPVLEGSLVERLRDAVRRFEGSHPTLTAITGRIVDQLAELGI